MSAVLSFLGTSCFLIAYLFIGTASLTLPVNPLDNPDSLTIASPINASDAITAQQCTSSLIWTGNTAYDTQFTHSCYEAWNMFVTTDMLTYKTTEFEFSYQGVQSSYPDLPKMNTPRRYIHGESTPHIGPSSHFADEALPRFVHHCNCQSCRPPQGDIATGASRTFSAVGYCEVP